MLTVYNNQLAISRSFSTDCPENWHTTNPICLYDLYVLESMGSANNFQASSFIAHQACTTNHGVYAKSVLSWLPAVPPSLQSKLQVFKKEFHLDYEVIM